MFDTITNLPWHPLVVHAAIVLIPLAAWVPSSSPPRARGTACTASSCSISSFIATGAAFVAKESGEQLASRVGLPEDHARWGTWVVLSAGLLFLSVAALWWPTAAARCARRP